MNAPSNTIVSGCANGPQNELSDKERRQRWFEIFLVVLVAFGGYLVSALYLLLHGPTAESQVSSFRAAGNIVQEVAALLLLGYVLSRRGLKFSSLGLRWSLSDVRMGLLLTSVSYATFGVGYTLVQAVHHLVYGSWSDGPLREISSRTLPSWRFP